MAATKPNENSLKNRFYVPTQKRVPGVYAPDIAERIKHLLPEGVHELLVFLVSRDDEPVVVWQVFLLVENNERGKAQAQAHRKKRGIRRGGGTGTARS